jgi:hypothetical protein
MATSRQERKALQLMADALRYDKLDELVSWMDEIAERKLDADDKYQIQLASFVIVEMKRLCDGLTTALRHQIMLNKRGSFALEEVEFLWRKVEKHMDDPEALSDKLGISQKRANLLIHRAKEVDRIEQEKDDKKTRK